MLLLSIRRECIKNTLEILVIKTQEIKGSHCGGSKGILVMNFGLGNDVIIFKFNGIKG